MKSIISAKYLVANILSLDKILDKNIPWKQDFKFRITKHIYTTFSGILTFKMLN